MFQIIQKTLTNIEVQYIASDKHSKSTESKIIVGILDRVGDCELTVNKVTTLDRTKTGKFKTIKSEL